MMSRGAVRLSGALIGCMLAAAAWRLLSPASLLPNTAITATAPFACGLLIAPACAAFVMGVILLSGRARLQDRDDRIAWCTWGDFFVTGYVGILALAQTITLAMSLGTLRGLDADGVSRAVVATISVLLLIASNRMAKLPWLRPFGCGRLPANKGAKLQRFTSTLLFYLSLCILAASVAAPRPVLTGVVFGGTCVTGIASQIRRHVLLRS